MIEEHYNFKPTPEIMSIGEQVLNMWWYFFSFSLFHNMI